MADLDALTKSSNKDVATLSKFALAQAKEAAGKLTLANTLGAVSGALLTGFVLLPRVGVERTLFASTLAYGLVAWLAMVVPVGAPPQTTPSVLPGVRRR